MNITNFIIPSIIFLILLSGVIVFVRYFLAPAITLETTLRDAVTKLEQLRQDSEWDLSACFSGDNALVHMWQEYKESLHKQTVIDPDTQSHVVSNVRATLPAEAFFSTQSIVDHKVHTEFFKHLPGLFTGVGIIGTFTGLIAGLQNFAISQDADVVRKSLNGLLTGVSHAFYVSAGAIFFAMLATALEKFYVNRLYGLVERLNRLVDGRFEAGAGEEYLSRLVAAAEDSSSQTRILKDALVTDLKQILTDLSDKQIAATQQSTLALGHQISETLAGALKDPLDQIAGAVGHVSQDQSGAVSKLLTDVLAGFSQKLEEMFGSQLSGIGEMQRRTIDALETAVARLQEMTSNVEAAGSRTTEAMAEKLAAAMATFASRLEQKAINDELSSVMQQLRATASETQAETQANLKSMLAGLGDQLGQAVATLQEQSVQRAAEQSEREHRNTEAAASQVERIGSEVGHLTTGVDQVLEAVGVMITKLENVTGNLVTQMNSGSENLLLAAGEFEKAGREASQSFSKMATVSQGLDGAATSVAGAARSLDSVVSDYKAAREATTLMVATIKEIVDLASRDVSITSDVLGRIESAANKLAAAQNEADHYLAAVTEVLSTSHQEFANGMKLTVGEANIAFHNELTQATGLLRNAIQELDLALPTGSRPAQGL